MSNDNELCNQCGKYDGSQWNSYCTVTGEPDPDENMEHVECPHFIRLRTESLAVAEAKVELLYGLHKKRRLCDGEACNYRGVTCNQQNKFSDCVKTLIDEGEI